VTCYIPRWFTGPQAVTHPSTNRDQCRLTTLIEANALTTTLRRHLHTSQIRYYNVVFLRHCALYKFTDLLNYLRCTAQLQTVAWNSRGQHDYLLIYRFEWKSALDAGSLLWMSVSFFAICGQTIHPTAKVSEEVNTKRCPQEHDGTTFNPLHRPFITDRQRDRQTDRR